MANDFSNESSIVADWHFEQNYEDSEHNFDLQMADVMDLTPTYSETNCPGDTDGGSYSIEIVNRNQNGTNENYLYLGIDKQNELLPGSVRGTGWKHQAFSGCMWFYLHSLDPGGAYSDYYGLMALYRSWGLFHDSDGDLFFQIHYDNSHTYEARLSEVLAINTWYFSGFTYTPGSPNSIALWLYGSEGAGSDATNTDSNNMQNYENWFGVGAPGHQPYYRCMDGLLDAIQLFKGKTMTEDDFDDIRDGTYS